eukprot:4491447-Pleurochrysis_carterae.AAC.2
MQRPARPDAEGPFATQPLADGLDLKGRTTVSFASLFIASQALSCFDSSNYAHNFLAFREKRLCTYNFRQSTYAKYIQRSTSSTTVCTLRRSGDRASDEGEGLGRETQRLKRA